METILKWFSNNQKSDSVNRNSVISRTMLKIAVISRFVQERFVNQEGKLPNPGELWRCRIAKESGSGRNKGCFVVEPLCRVDETEVVKLVPGTFDMKLVGKQLIIRPHPEYNGQCWMMPLQHKRVLAEEHGAYCVIVDLDSTPLKPGVVSKPHE